MLFLSFDLMINLLVARSIMRLKFTKNAFLSFNLMIDLLAASAIMRSNVFMHRWLMLIIRAKN